MDKHAIIKLKKKGISNRKAAEILGINRKTIATYWNAHEANENLLNDSKSDVKEIQAKICEAPKYNSVNRKSRKYCPDMDSKLDSILEISNKFSTNFLSLAPPL